MLVNTNQSAGVYDINDAIPNRILSRVLETPSSQPAASLTIYPYVSGETKVRGLTCKSRKKGAQLVATNPIIVLQEGDEYGVNEVARQKEREQIAESFFFLIFSGCFD